MKGFFILVVVILLGFAIYNAFTAGGGINLKKFFVVPGIGSSTVSYVQAPPTVPVGPAPYTPTPPAPTPPSGFTVDQLSPYYGSVRISSFLRSWYYGGTYEVDLYSDYSIKNGVDVTNWRLKGNAGEIMIPQAVKKYPPYGFPLDADIVVGSGEYIKIFSGASPIARNLELNKCTGYLNNIYAFAPAIPNNCPSLDLNEVSTFTGACQSFIRSIYYGCRQPTANELNLYTGYRDEACHAYLERINYRGCYEKHAGDSDFFSREWWIWTGGTFPFDSAHDRLLLFDRSGLLVNEYTY